MEFQAVVLAGGTSKSLVPLVSKDVPKALLPVANRPVLSYVLELLESSNLKDLIVVVEGQDNAVRVGGWISSAHVDRLQVEVADVPDDVGTAGALRSMAHHLIASDILVVSGDLVCDVPPGAVAAIHRRHNAAVTALLCAVPVGGHSETGGSGGKDKAKKPGQHNIIGLDPTKQFLLNVATGADVHKDLRILKTILRASGQMEIRSNLMDAHFYAFKRAALLDVLNQHPSFHSIKQDVVPYLVKSQLLCSLKSEVSVSGASQMEEGWKGMASQTDHLWYTQRQMGPVSTFDDRVAGFPHDFFSVRRLHKCCVYIASCVRLNSIQAFCDINRDVIGDASHLSGYSFSSQNNIIHPSAELGNKTTVGPNCMLGEGSQLGDKCSVKRSVIGCHCRIGSNVKIANSVVMNYVTIEDGCSIQGSVICSNVHLQDRVVLKDCQFEGDEKKYKDKEEEDRLQEGGEVHDRHLLQLYKLQRKGCM